MAAREFPAEWFDHAFFREHAALSRGNVLDYFAKSPFFDTTCAHAKLMLKGTDPWDRRKLLDPRFNGSIQYRLRGANNQRVPFFIIEEVFVKFNEANQPVASLTGVFVVQGIVIFPAPDVRNVLKNRLDNAKDLMETNFNALESFTSYSQSQGTVWLPTAVDDTDFAGGGLASASGAAQFSWKNDLASLTL